MKKKGFFGYRQYVIAGLLIALAAVGTTAIYSSRQEKEREQMEAELAEEMQILFTDDAALYDSIEKKNELLMKYAKLCRHNISGKKISIPAWRPCCMMSPE